MVGLSQPDFVNFPERNIPYDVAHDQFVSANALKEFDRLDIYSQTPAVRIDPQVSWGETA
jgi:hypothetical protein